MTNQAEYDVVVIGAGPVGENVADRTKAAGLSTVILEHELVGGECSYWACEPSKALLRPMLARTDASRVTGLEAGPLDASAVLTHRDEVVHHWRDEGQVEWLKSVGVDLIRGHGRLDGPRRVTVLTTGGETIELTARHAVVVCTGSGAAMPDTPGLDTVAPWTNREATGAGDVPGKLVIIGGGVVAAEMAAAWQSLGSKTTMLVRGRLLSKMEQFAGEMVADALREAGVDIRFGAEVASLAREDGEDGEDGVVTVTLADGEKLTADEILVATGRTPRTNDLGLETVGLTPGEWLPVDDTGRVSAVADGWLYACGDVNRRALLTHQGKYQARMVGAAIAARAKGEPVDDAAWGAHVTTADAAAVPQVVFTDPEVAAVGLTTHEAQRTGRRVEVVDYEIGNVAGAQHYAKGYRGKARMLVDAERETVVGVTFVGPGVGELLHSATIAVAGQVPIARLWHAVPSFPTISEVWLRLLETYRDR